MYFWRDWLVLVPAGLAAVRDRSFRGDPDRRLAWLIAITTIPAVIVGPILNDRLETAVRSAGIVAVTLVIGGAILWLADRWGRQVREATELTFGQALGIGVAQAIALVPGISRSGISISAGLFFGLTRESAARFSFLMATPITAAAGAYEIVQLVRGEAGGGISAGPLVVGMVAAAHRRAGRDPPPVALPAHELADDLRGLSARAGRRRHRVLPVPAALSGRPPWRS